MKKAFRVLAMFLSILLIFQMIPLNASAIEEALLQAQVQKTETLENTATDEPFVVSEDASRREENVKHFKMSDGTYRAAVYDVPVHYNDNGEWKDLDSSIKENSSVSKRNGKYYAVIDDTEFSFPDKISNEDRIKIKKGSHEVSFGYINDRISLFSSSDLITSSERQTENTIGKNKKTDCFGISNNTLVYSNVSSATDISYELNSSILKESIVVSERQTEYVYKFSLDVGTLTPVLNGNGSISLVDKNNADSLEFVITAPFMIDAKGIFSDSVEMSLSSTGDEYVLTVTADKEWLNDESREFPVIIDPTLLCEPNRVNGIFDTYVDSGSPSENHYLSTYSIIGYNSLGTGRAYIKFDFPSMPNCGVITNATLELLQMGYDPGNGVTNHMVVYESPSEQNYKTLTWINQPSLVNQPIVDYTVFKSGANASVSYSLDITKIAKNWFENGINNGLFLASANESSSWRSTIYTSNYSGYDIYPMIVLSYIDNVGLEDYWSYETIDMGRSGTVYINEYNGLLTYVHQDISLGGNVTYLSAAHVYSNNYGSQPGPYGYGFRLTAQESITRLAESSELYTSQLKYRAYLTDADGTAHYFLLKDDGKWHYEFDDNVILTYNASTGFILEYEDGSKKTYDTEGKLLSIEDRNGNKINQHYDSEGRVTSVVDALGRSIVFTYENGFLTSSTDDAGRVTTYTYVDGYLRTITYPDGKTTQLSYESNKLFSIRQTDKTSVKFMYSSSKRVNYVRMDGTDNTTPLKSVNFYYNASNTVISDSQGRELTVGFDNFGRAISYTDKDGNTSSAKYNSGGNKNNKVAESSGAFAFSQNLLLNNSFEGDKTNWFDAATATGTQSCVVDTSTAYVGNKSIKFTRSSAGRILLGQAINAPVTGIEYTLSGYFYTQLMNGAFCGLRIEAYDANNTMTLLQKSDTISTNTYGWKRLQTTFTLPAGTVTAFVYAYLEGTSGTAYFDAVQLEKASSAGHYNLVNNPGFDRVDGNNFHYWTEVGTVSLSTGVLSGNATGITGSITGTARNVQTVNVGATTKEKTLVIGATVKGNCVESSNSEDFPAKCGILVNGYDAASNKKDSVFVEYNAHGVGVQQSLVGYLTLDPDVTFVNLYLIYDYNANAAYFDNVFMYLDSFGTVYSYTDDGKLEMQNNTAGDVISYEYTGPDVSKISVKKDGEETDSCTYEYDAKHNVTKETTKSGIVTEYSYPSINRGMPTKVTVKSADGTLQSSVSYSYVLMDNYTRSVTDARGYIKSYYYNSDKDLLLSYTDERGNTYEYEYNPQNDELETVYLETDSGNRVSVDYFTDNNGNLSLISQDGVEYEFTYDVMNRRTATYVDGIRLASYSYNSRGLLSETAYGNGATCTLTYDDSDRVIGEAYDGTASATYSYNSEGYLGKTIDHGLGITTYYNYDLVGRVTDVTSSDGLKSEFGYNEQNLISSYSVAKNGTEISEADYDYTEDGLISEVSFSGAVYGEFTYSYDKLNRVTKQENNIGGIPMSVRYSYLAGTNSNTTGLVSNILYDDSGTKYVPELNYTYYADGNIHLVKENGTLVNSYAYDELGRLVRENDLNQNKTVKYIYDNRGNILRKDYYNYSLDGNLTYTGAVNYVYSDNWEDRLTSYNGQSITYDRIGNPLTYRGYTLTWEKGRQLKSIENSSYDLEFKYNSDGLRTEKKVNGTTYTYTWSSGLLMQLSGNGNTLKFGYSPDGRALSVDYNGADYYYVYNLQGDVIALYNTGGNVVVEYTYDSWGRILSVTGSLANTLGAINPLRYRGYLYDGETKLYYVSSRYYDPEVGRFINADTTDIITATPMGLTDKNLFAYCDNNPIMRIDKNGQIWVHIAIGAAIGGVSSFASTLISTKSVSDALISLGFGAAEGALSAAVPTLSPLFGAVFSAAESVVIDLKNQKSTSEVLINATISAGFGALSAVGDDYFSSKSFVDDFTNQKNLKKAFYTKNTAKTKKAAVNASLEFKKKCFKEAQLSGIDSAGYFALEEGTKWYAQAAYSYAVR